MKSTKLIVCFALVSTVSYAQTSYDAQRLSENELNGTARFVGMGGAMGSLGADISVINTNPAGIGLFRRNNFSTTFGFNTNVVKSDFGGNKMKEKNTAASFDQAGFVYSMKIGNKTDLRYVNFGFNYHKSSNFNRIFSSGGFLNDFSQTQQMANLIGGAIDNIEEMDRIYNYDLSKDPFKQSPYYPNVEGDPTIPTYPYLGVMGVRTELVGVGSDDKGEFPIGWLGDKNYYFSHEEGGIYQYDFNVAFNVQDKMYFGITLGVHDVDYKRYTSYSENIFDGPHSGYYELNNVMKTEGTGVGVKFGAIFRPIDDSPFRFGFAVHTPIWYDLTDIYDSHIYSEITYQDKDEAGNPVERKFTADEYVSDYLDGETLQEYKLTTPWKFNVNMGTVLGGMMALGAEYEYTDYSTSKLHYVDGYDMDYQNNIISEDLKGMHTLRLGMETRITNNVSLRAGYNYSSSSFKDSAYKSLAWNDMRTDVEYNNKFDQHTATLGIGYRGKLFYVDAAYKYNTYKSDFNAFSADGLEASKLNNDRHQVLMTLGIQF